MSIYVSIKMVCLELSIQLMLSWVISDVLCLSMRSPPHGLVDSTGGERGKEQPLCFISRTFKCSS